MSREIGYSATRIDEDGFVENTLIDMEELLRFRLKHAAIVPATYRSETTLLAMEDALDVAYQRLRYAADLWHDQGNHTRAEADWKASDDCFKALELSRGLK